LAGSLLLAAMIGAGPVQAAGDPDVGLRKAPGEVKVLTLNQYFGADLAPLLAASSLEALNEAVLQVLAQAAANDFPARARRQAEEIARRRPDLVGLQEVLHLECRDLPPTPGACAEPSIAGAFVDQLGLTLRALRARGAAYKVAARVENFGFRDITVGGVQGLPFIIGGKIGLLVSVDQDVILARAGVRTEPVSFTDCRQSAQGCNYRTSASVPLPVPGGALFEFEVKRGYVAVDAKVRGRGYRFVNTHLEVQEPQPGNPLSIAIQAGQAAELLAALAADPAPPGWPLILAGDLNSSPTDAPVPTPVGTIVPPYQQVVAAGFVDAWAARHGPAPGFTCCQDADLRNEVSELSERIDLVFAKAQPVLVKRARVVLDDPEDRTPPKPGQPRLWPSDHAGVVALLNFWGLIPPGGA
jgi:endonuclease/exonuclease/phosphatase family metal-dependent hydrolase